MKFLDVAYYIGTITLIYQNLIERVRSTFHLFLANTIKVAIILSVIKYINYLSDIYIK